MKSFPLKKSLPGLCELPIFIFTPESVPLQAIKYDKQLKHLAWQVLWHGIVHLKKYIVEMMP